MIKVIVVDDEKVIRDGIGRFIKETDGFLLLCTCEDGIEAFAKITEELPDLVICDIIMPHCDGIELIGKCREAGIKSEFVLLSGYSEFEYAKAGIKYGVLDYVNKPISRHLFQGILEAAQAVIENKKSMKKQLQSTAYEKMFDSAGTQEEPEVVWSDLPQRVLVVNTDTGETGEARQKNLNATIEFCETLLKKHAHEEYIVNKRSKMAVLILLGEDTKDSSIKKLCREIGINANGRGFHAVVGAGDIVFRTRDIPVSYKQAKAAQYEARVLNQELCYFEQLPYSYKSPSGTYMPEFADIVNAVHRQDQESVLEKVRKAIEHYRKSLPPYFLYDFIRKCAQELVDCAAEYLEEEELQEKKSQQTELITAPNLEILYDRFQYLTETLFQETKEKRGKQNYEGTIDEVLQYIQLQYTGDISIEKICSVFFFNQSYFSVLFKTKTGANYNDYVMELRIKKAKELLSTGRYKVNEIADMVGYNSSRYFSRVFKMKTGELPQEYKNRKINAM